MSTPIVTMTIKELVAMRPSLDALLDAKLPVRASYRATKFSKKVIREFELIDKSRKDLVKKHGEKIDDGSGSYKVKKENLDAFQAEFDSLMEEPVEFPVMKLTLEEIEHANLSVGDIANLEFMIEEPANSDSK